jgi:hypothetical protein
MRIVEVAPVVSERCPRCDARPGDSCVSDDGKEVPFTHVARKQAWATNLGLEWEGVFDGRWTDRQATRKATEILGIERPEDTREHVGTRCDGLDGSGRLLGVCCAPVVRRGRPLHSAFAGRRRPRRERCRSLVDRGALLRR